MPDMDRYTADSKKRYRAGDSSRTAKNARALERKKAKQAQQAADKRRRKRLTQYDPTVRSTTHDRSCGMFSYQDCDCM